MDAFKWLAQSDTPCRRRRPGRSRPCARTRSRARAPQFRCSTP
uniref:Uncharacterized protein n=1 Tax=Arundo donax TaxID=35708 RepID=A0A0A8ZW15_ARUDO